MSEMKERRDREIREFFQNNRAWSLEDLREIDNDNTQDKIDVIWQLNELLKAEQGEKYLDDAVKVAEIYCVDENPAPGDEHDKSIRKNEDVRYIYTVKGTLAYLLSTAISKFDIRVYGKLIDIVDALLQDGNAYVRMHAAIPLGSLCAVKYATKKADGSAFDLSDEARNKIQDIAFRTLRENHDLPRVLEFLTGAVNWLRRMSEADARSALDAFIFLDREAEKYQPTYVLRDITMLLIYYAEFRTQINDNFNPAYFKELIGRCLSDGPSEFRSSIIWHFWKTTEDDPANLSKVRGYIPQFFQGEYENHYVQQLSLFTEHVLKADANVGVETYVMLVDYVLEKMNHSHGVLWFLDMDRILPLISEYKPDAYIESLRKLKELLLRRNIFIADYQAAFTAYSSMPASKRKQIKDESQAIYKDLQRAKEDLPDLVWPE